MARRMPRTTIDRLIINSPYEEPAHYRRIAVKIVDDQGIESLKVVELPE